MSKAQPIKRWYINVNTGDCLETPSGDWMRVEDVEEVFPPDVAFMPVPDWQPIETAPKDGSDVLVWAADWDNPCVLRWSSRGQWDDGSGDSCQDYQPTHWTLIPPLPESAP